MPIQAYISNLFATSSKQDRQAQRPAIAKGRREGRRDCLHFVEPRAFIRHVAAQSAELPDDETWRASLNLVGLEELRRRMGAQWTELAARVHSAAERIIDKLLPDGGVFTRSRDGHFALLLPVGRRNDADAICEAISRKIENYCLGEPELQNIRVEHQLFAAGDRCPDDEMAVEAPEKNNRTELNLTGMLASGIGQQPRLELAMPAFRPSANPAARRLESGPTSTHPDRRFFGYQPILDAHKETVWAYRQIEIEPDYSEITESFGSSGPTALLEKQRLERDIEAVRLTASFASAWPEHCSSAVVIVTVGIETLSVRHFRLAYMAALAGLPTRIRNRLVLEIVGCPAGTPSGKITECASYIRPHVRGIWLRVSSFRSIPANLAGSGICGIGVHLTDIPATAAAIMADANKFSGAAESQRMNGYVFGIDKGAAAAACCESRVRFLAGEAVGQAKAAPGRAYKATRPCCTGGKCSYAAA